jgi:hypothetical protein
MPLYGYFFVNLRKAYSRKDMGDSLEIYETVLSS